MTDTAAPTPPPPADAPKVLIVDDEAVGREAITALLASAGYQLATAASGRAALDEAARWRPDVILLDVMMPGMDGFEVCTALRADPRLAEVPVIMVTALDDRAARLRAIECGADDFLSKPFDRVELRTRVRATVQLNRYRRLLAERERFSWVVEHAREGFLLLDRAGVATYANAAARALLELDAAAPLPPAPWIELARRVYRCEPDDAWQAWPNGLGAGAQLLLVRPETRSAPALWLEVSRQAPRDGGEGVVVRLADVTAQIVARSDMHAFRTLISHKLRTPVNHVFSGLELVLNDDTLSDDERTRFARMAFQGAQRLRQSVEEVLRDIEAAPIGEPRQCLALGDLPALAQQCAATVPLDGAAVAVQVPAALAAEHCCLTPAHVELLLTELLDNARKFHPTHTPTVAIAVDAAPGRQVVLRVADDGVHLSPVQLQRVWAPYYQGDKHFTGEVPGLGLGLAYVATLVWRVGGECRLRNRPDGPGIIAELTLPLCS